jgi:hypothetical protein
MSRVRGAVLSLPLCVAFSICTSVAGAEPVRLTSGYVDAGYNWTPDRLNANALEIAGAGFKIANAMEDEVAFVELTTAPTLGQGRLVDLSGVLHVEDVIGAQLDSAFGLVSAPFTMSFDAQPTELACSTSSAFLECMATAPFTFHAGLTFTPIDGNPSVHHLVGSGTALGNLFRPSSDEAGAAVRVRYTFDVSEVPEPTTMSLFGSGALFTGACMWRRRRQRSIAAAGCGD